MKLRSGESIWQLLHRPPPSFPSLAEDAECDVVIVGGGVTGALIAKALVEVGVECILLDQREPGQGSTLASTALILYELDTHLCDLAEQIGEPRAKRCYVACRDAVLKIQKLATDLGPECRFRKRTSFYFAETGGDVAALETECRIRRRCGLDVDLIRQAEIEHLFSFSRPAALVSQTAGDLDIRKFVERLFETAQQGGLRIYGRTRMTSRTRTSSVQTLQTEGGFQIRCRQIVFATGYESEKYLPQRIGILKSTFALATAPVADFPGWHEQSPLWTSARPYLYLRTTAEGNVVIGGEDIEACEPEARDALIPEKAATLEAHLRTLFPQMEFEVACAWAGTFGETKDSLARIGRAPGMPGAYFALGYGGNGVTYSILAADIIRDLHLGRTSQFAPLFAFEGA